MEKAKPEPILKVNPYKFLNGEPAAQPTAAQLPQVPETAQITPPPTPSPPPMPSMTKAYAIDSPLSKTLGIDAFKNQEKASQ